MSERSAVPSLLFHDVADEATVGGAPWTLSRASFRQHLQAITASGRTAMSISQFADGLAGLASLPEKPVVISFDDGYASWRWAAEQLSLAGLEAATMYITTGWLNMPGYLGSADLAELPGWVDVGAHGVTHRRLDELSTAEVAREVHQSKDLVEQLGQRECRSFAYPHGNYDRRSKSALLESGLHSGAAVRNAFSHSAEDVLALSRLTITADTSAQTLQDYLLGRGAPLGWTREKLLSRGYRYVRRGVRASDLAKAREGRS